MNNRIKWYSKHNRLCHKNAEKKFYTFLQVVRFLYSVKIIYKFYNSWHCLNKRIKCIEYLIEESSVFVHLMLFQRFPFIIMDLKNNFNAVFYFVKFYFILMEKSSEDHVIVSVSIVIAFRSYIVRQPVIPKSSKKLQPINVDRSVM